MDTRTAESPYNKWAGVKNFRQQRIGNVSRGRTSHITDFTCDHVLLRQGGVKLTFVLMVRDAVLDQYSCLYWILSKFIF